jgi:hypothetical protein
VSLVYLDSSALLKLVVTEPESAVLAEFLRGHSDRVSSALALTEVPRALGRAGFGTAERRRAREVLTRVALVVENPGGDPSRHHTDSSRRPDGPGDYDRRLAAAAKRADIEVLAPR